MLVMEHPKWWPGLTKKLASLAIQSDPGIVGGGLGGTHGGAGSHSRRPRGARPSTKFNSAAPTASCTVAERVSVGLEFGAPFLDTHTQDRCITTNTAAGIALSYSIWILQLLTGALAALFVAGLTGIVRKI